MFKGEFKILVITLILLFGYIKNIINIVVQFETPLSELTLVIIFQIIGIPVFPLGMILGLIIW